MIRNLSENHHRRRFTYPKSYFGTNYQPGWGLRFSGQGKSTPAVSKHSTALCSGIPKARLRKNPNGFPHGTKSQQGTRAFRNTNYDHQRNAQPLFPLAGLGSSLSSRTSISIFSFWLLLSHFPSSGVRDYQLVPHEHYSSSSLENSSSALGDRNRIALSSRCDLQRRCDSNDDWTYRPCDGIDQQSHHRPLATSQIQKYRSSQTLVRRSYLRCLFAAYQALFSFLRKPYGESLPTLKNANYSI